MIPPPAGVRAPDPWVRLVSMEGATRRQAEVLAHVGLAPLPLSDLVAAAGTTRDTVRRMAQRGLVALDPAPRAPADDVRVTLTPEQEPAVAACAEALAAGGGDVLVHGVTGSGKTEVYLRAIDAALRARARRDRARARDRAHAADRRPLHRPLRAHGRRPAQRHLARRAAAPSTPASPRARRASSSARARRSSRPVPDLGVIVVDEEHDASYKHEADPRYDARRVAAKRARLQGAVVHLRKRHAAPGVLVRDPPAGQPPDPGGRAAARSSTSSTCAPTAATRSPGR